MYCKHFDCKSFSQCYNWIILGSKTPFLQKKILSLEDECTKQQKWRDTKAPSYVLVLSLFSHIWLQGQPHEEASQAPSVHGISGKNTDSCHFLLGIFSWLQDKTQISCVSYWQVGSLPLVRPGKLFLMPQLMTFEEEQKDHCTGNQKADTQNSRTETEHKLTSTAVHLCSWIFLPRTLQALSPIQCLLFLERSFPLCRISVYTLVEEEWDECSLRPHP